MSLALTPTQQELKQIPLTGSFLFEEISDAVHGLRLSNQRLSLLQLRQTLNGFLCALPFGIQFGDNLVR